MSGATILVVDDEPQIGRALRTTLATMGYMVIVSPEQAFRIMMKLKDPHRTLVFLVAVTDSVSVRPSA
jgi:DNA-binding NtrC family response regulator